MVSSASHEIRTRFCCDLMYCGYVIIVILPIFFSVVSLDETQPYEVLYVINTSVSNTADKKCRHSI